MKKMDNDTTVEPDFIPRSVPSLKGQHPGMSTEGSNRCLLTGGFGRLGAVGVVEPGAEPLATRGKAGSRGRARP